MINLSQVAPSLQDKAVLLRIEAESQEATFLSAFCPITKAPMVVVVKSVLLQMKTVRALTDLQLRR